MYFLDKKIKLEIKLTLGHADGRPRLQSPRLDIGETTTRFNISDIISTEYDSSATSDLHAYRNVSHGTVSIYIYIYYMLSEKIVETLSNFFCNQYDCVGPLCGFFRYKWRLCVRQLHQCVSMS